MLQKGSVVRSTAGRDKDRFYCVVELGRDSVMIADGKLRKLERPKRKNIKHIQATETVLEPAAAGTNKQLKASLRPFNGALQTGSTTHKGR